MLEINTLKALQKNPTFMALVEKQCDYDAADQAMRNSAFTRSSLHPITFLVAYAGLTDAQKAYVITRLNIPLVTKEKLDELIRDVNWEAVFFADSQATLSFNFSVEVISKDAFFEAMRVNGNFALTDILSRENSPVKITENPTGESLVFTTKVEQTEEWERPFISSEKPDYWKVRCFTLSEEMEAAISRMPVGERKRWGNFMVTKGDGPEIKLLVQKGPGYDETWSKEEKVKTKAGIYDAFNGLCDFYGLDCVAEVHVWLKSAAELSAKGTWVAQTQEVVLLPRGCSRESGTLILVDQCHLLYPGAGIAVDFNGKIGGNAPLTNFIRLHTKSKETWPILYPRSLTSQEAFTLANKERTKSSRPSQVVSSPSTSYEVKPLDRPQKQAGYPTASAHAQSYLPIFSIPNYSQSLGKPPQVDYHPTGSQSYHPANGNLSSTRRSAEQDSKRPVIELDTSIDNENLVYLLKKIPLLPIIL